MHLSSKMAGMRTLSHQLQKRRTPGIKTNNIEGLEDKLCIGFFSGGDGKQFGSWSSPPLSCRAASVLLSCEKCCR